MSWPLPRLVLGTALWGWNIDRPTAHAMLDLFAARGGTLIDTASNYPINGIPQDFGRAGAWAGEWLSVHRGGPVGVWAKIGALDNAGGADAQLSPSFVMIAHDLARARYGDALDCLGIHWDNRRDPVRIGETLAVFRDLLAQGLNIGLSGLADPALHAATAPDLAPFWRIQIKENILDNAARRRYAPHFPANPYYAYGINIAGAALAGQSAGLRGVTAPPALDQVQAWLTAASDLEPPPMDFNQLALMRAAATPALAGVIVGPRTLDQLGRTLDAWDAIGTHLTRQTADRVLALDFGPPS